MTGGAGDIAIAAQFFVEEQRPTQVHELGIRRRQCTDGDDSPARELGADLCIE